jgi:hypothetical protein
MYSTNLEVGYDIYLQDIVSILKKRNEGVVIYNILILPSSNYTAI